MTKLVIHVDSTEGIDDLRSLLGWLKRDQALLGYVETRSESLERDQMGMLSTVAVTLGSGSAISALAVSLRTWIIQRRSDLSVVVTGPDGRSVRIDAKRVSNAEALIRQVVNEPKIDD